MLKEEPLSLLNVKKNSELVNVFREAVLFAMHMHNRRHFSLGEGGNSTLIRRVCATDVLNLSPCSGVGKPKKDTLLWSYHSFLKSIVLYCIVLYCIVLYCIVLYCIVLYCIVLLCFVLYCIINQSMLYELLSNLIGSLLLYYDFILH